MKGIGLRSKMPRLWSVLGRPLQITVHLCYRTDVLSVCHVCLSVTLVYCAKTVIDRSLIKMPRPWRHCVRWGTSSPRGKGHSNTSSQFSAHACCGQTDAYLSNC